MKKQHLTYHELGQVVRALTVVVLNTVGSLFLDDLDVVHCYAGVMTLALRAVILLLTNMNRNCAGYLQMATAQSKQPRKTRETLNLRIRAEDRALIDHAAKARGKTRTDFILDTVRVAAESALLEQAYIQASPAAFAKFLEQLDAPPNPNARLKKTMQTPAPWDK